MIIIETKDSYYGTYYSRLIAVIDTIVFYDNLIELNLVDNEVKDFMIGYVPNTLKLALKHRCKVSFLHEYLKAFIKLFGSRRVITNEIKSRLLIFAAIEEDNKQWNKKGTTYELKGGNCRKLPVAVSMKHIENFYKKHGNYFQLDNFNTIDEAYQWVNNTRNNTRDYLLTTMEISDNIT